MSTWRLAVQTLGRAGGTGFAADLQRDFWGGGDIGDALKIAASYGMAVPPGQRGLSHKPWRLTRLGWDLYHGKVQAVRLPGAASHGGKRGRVRYGHNWIAPLQPVPMTPAPSYAEPLPPPELVAYKTMPACFAGH